MSTGLSSVSIRRPVFTLVLAIAIIIFGVISFNNLGVREFPSTERPIISVTANYPGASSEVIENQVTEPLEESINTVPGIRTLTSVSREGRSTITVEFGLGYDLDVAANDVRDRVAAAQRRLPPDLDPPTVQKADADGDPIIFLNVSSDSRNLLELTEIGDRIFRNRLQTIPGVARVDIWGSREYAMRLWLDPNRLAAYQLTPLDVRNALAAANVDLPSGRLDAEFLELGVRTLSRLGDDPAAFERIILKSGDEGTVYLSDVGHVELGALNERTVLKRNGVPMIGVVIRPQVGANEIEIADEFYRRVEQIKTDLPADIELAVGFDTTEFIRDSIAEVQQTIFVALSLVCLTIFLFLREGRSSIIPLLTIPIALIGAFFIMYLAGFTINVLTLLGMVLAIGIVVDDAVVVLENIYAKIEQGMDPKEAALKGIKEIFLAIVSTTLALTAVFMPLLFLGGMTGFLFREFGMTLAGAVIISSFIALTLTPMLSSRLLKAKQHGWFYRKTEPFYKKLNFYYRESLETVLQHRWLAGVIMVVCFGAIGLFYQTLPRELAPLEDRGLLVVRVTGPEGTNFDYMSTVMDTVDQKIREAAPEVEATLSVTSPGFGAATTTNTGFARVVLPPSENRERSQAQIAASISQALRGIPEADIFVSQPPTLRVGGRGLPVQFVVQNPNFDQLKDVLPDFLEAARERPEFGIVDIDLRFNRPELRVEINRDRAEALGISVRDIAETLQASLSEQRFGYFLRDGKQYEIIGQIQRDLRSEPLDLTRITLRSRDGQIVSMDNVVRVYESTSPNVLYRFNRFSSATFSASLSDGYTLGEGIAAMQSVADGLLDESFSTELAGESREFTESGQSLLFVFFFALVLVYLVLSAQFESFRDPFIIMLTVPLALGGGLFALWYTGQSLNIFSQIGLIMLIGLITKNGILLVEFGNQRRAAGLPIREAIADAASARFRPILMTTISTILGTLPIALALGAGAESRKPLGIAVIGGLILGSIFTLYVIPAAYSLLASREATIELDEDEVARLRAQRDRELVGNE
ncbi:MAG: efflux RND transporter permease subunit [Opitutales bacterium]|nr:efflux RND transporter permease subunit [Opitutales bacterium]